MNSAGSMRIYGTGSISKEYYEKLTSFVRYSVNWDKSRTWSSEFVFLSVEANGDAAKVFNFEESKEYLKPSEEGKKLPSEVREPRYKNIVHLWEFLLELLAEDNCRPLITWTSKERGEFKLKNPEEVAKRWGILKRKKGMNYEKLGRALRYYYQQGIIKKVGRFSCFMFILCDNI